MLAVHLSMHRAVAVHGLAGAQQEYDEQASQG